MQKDNLKRVNFFSKRDLAAGHELLKGEHILRNQTKPVYDDINDVLEIYNIKKYIDNEIYLKNWNSEDIANFELKAKEYGKIVGKFMSKLNDNNFTSHFENLLRSYVNPFLELINDQKTFKNISAENFSSILTEAPYLIRNILKHNSIVTFYSDVLKEFLLSYPESAEILLSIYEAEQDFYYEEMFLPKNLTIKDKENILSKYIDSNNVNMNYLELIIDARDKPNFKIPPKIRLNAKRCHKAEVDKLFSKGEGNIPLSYGVSVSFSENLEEIKKLEIDGLNKKYYYNLKYLKQNKDIYSLYLNFKLLFEYTDIQNRINLISKKKQLDVMERHMGIRSQNEYVYGNVFRFAQMTSQAQIFAYNRVINDLDETLENIFQTIFSLIFNKLYNFANNARLTMPANNISFFEKIRLLAPEFESVLKQFKLFVEEGNIDFELLQISSSPSTIKEIPSLNQNKYIYLSENNEEVVNCLHLFFSDQTLLTHVEPHKEKQYHTFFNLLINEEVKLNSYEEYQKTGINYLIEKGYIGIDANDFIKISSKIRLFILKDLYYNEVASFHYYPDVFQVEVMAMVSENLIFFENTLLSKPEQDYLNFYLNKSVFTNGLDLRNSYLHGTQPNPEAVEEHEQSYFIYLKLLVLVLLKIEDDLFISTVNKQIEINNAAQ